MIFLDCVSNNPYIDTEKTNVEHILKKTLTLLYFCIEDPNITFFDVSEPPFTCQQEI